MKEITNNHNKKCSETNSLLLRYGFVEEYETVLRDNKVEELRFLYLQLKPNIGLLIYNFYHTTTEGDLQGFDMFMYDSNSIEDAIYQFHIKRKYKLQPEFNLLSFQNYLEHTQLILDRLIEENNDDFLVVESKYSKFLYNLNCKETEDALFCE